MGECFDQAALWQRICFSMLQRHPLGLRPALPDFFLGKILEALLRSDTPESSRPK